MQYSYHYSFCLCGVVMLQRHIYCELCFQSFTLLCTPHFPKQWLISFCWKRALETYEHRSHTAIGQQICYPKSHPERLGRGRERCCTPQLMDIKFCLLFSVCLLLVSPDGYMETSPNPTQFRVASLQAMVRDAPLLQQIFRELRSIHLKKMAF